MTISKPFQLTDNEELSPSDCEEISRHLSITNLDDIPICQRRNVEDYLTVALNMNSVEVEQISKLDPFSTSCDRLAKFCTAPAIDITANFTYLEDVCTILE
jgi:hypothetical protein